MSEKQIIMTDRQAALYCAVVSQNAVPTFEIDAKWIIKRAKEYLKFLEGKEFLEGEGDADKL
jgi:hypothetical protein